MPRATYVQLPDPDRPGRTMFVPKDEAYLHRERAHMVSGDIEPYENPITGEMITGRKQHREALARHGRRVLEKGEREDLIRDRSRRETAFENEVGRFLQDAFGDRSFQ